MGPENFDVPPSPERSRLAAFHTGTCNRCVRSLKDVEEDELLQGVATFGGLNNKGPLYGLGEPTPSMDPLLVEDRDAIRKELQYLFDNATLIEAMLVSLHHMQVSVCTSGTPAAGAPASPASARTSSASRRT